MSVKSRLCSLEGCQSKHLALGYCRAHYSKFKKYGDPLKTVRKFGEPETKCSVKNCGRLTRTHSDKYCSKHRRQISTHGRLMPGTEKSAKGSGLKFLRQHMCYESDECLKWPFGKSKGYGMLEYKGEQINAHRVMCTLLYGKPKCESLVAARTCGVLDCVNPTHIKWAAHSEVNCEIKVSNNNDIRGEKHHMHILTEEQVIAMRNDHRSNKVIAEEYGVHESTIRYARNKRNWSWL